MAETHPMKILEIISTVNPAYGGPVEGVREMAVQLRALGHSVDIACLDSRQSPWLKNLPAQIHALGPSFFKYGFSFIFINNI